MSRLEEHIRNSRKDLDIYAPPADTWEKVNKELRKRKSIRSRWISIAAMAVVVLGSAVLIIRQGGGLNIEGRADSISSELRNAGPDLRETEIYYTNLIKSLYIKASPLLSANPEVEKELMTDIAYLDSICVGIREDLKDNIDNQEVVEALIQNYRIRISILEDMLTLLKEYDSESKKPKEDGL